MNPQGHEVGDVTHERRDADVVNLMMIAFLLFLLIGLSLLVCWVILLFLHHNHVTNKPPRAQMVGQVAQFPEPQLLKEPVTEMRNLNLEESTRLRTYGWVDRKAGVARIPLERAMQLLLERGLPEVGAGQTRLQLLQSRPQTDIQPANPITVSIPQATP